MPVAQHETATAAEHRSAKRTRVWLVALFSVYLVLLAWIVLWKLELPHVGVAGVRQVKPLPFVADADFGANEPLEIAVNVVLFIPFGLYLGLIAPSWSWRRAVWVLAGASLVLETVQYLLAIGVSDTTDVIVNTAGGLAGLWLLSRTRRRFGAEAPDVMIRVCAVGTGLALVASTLFFLSPLHYSQPDVVVVGLESAP